MILEAIQERRRRRQTLEAAHELVAAALELVPDGLREYLERLDLRVAWRPEAEDFARGATSDLRGYFWGLPLRPDEESDGVVGCPDCLVPLELAAGRPLVALFVANIQPFCFETVARVLMHELGHYFGFDEFELVEGLGLA